MPSGELLVSTTPTIGMPSLLGFGDRDLLVADVDDEQRIGQAVHVLDAAQAALELVSSRW